MVTLILKLTKHALDGSKPHAGDRRRWVGAGEALASALTFLELEHNGAHLNTHLLNAASLLHCQL